jgi:hypothetical protein
MLPDGKVLTGLINGSQTYIYDPAANNWTATINSKLRSDQSDEESWVLLPDGSILSYDVFSSVATVPNQGRAQRYVPATQTWVDAGNVPVILSDGTVGAELGAGLLLSNGSVWFLGGLNARTAIYTPPTTPGGTGSWAQGPNLPGGYVAADAPAAVLPNGHVLLALSPQGSMIPDGKGGLRYSFPGTTKIYEVDPKINNPPYVEVTPATSLLDLSQQNAFQACMLTLPDGKVLYCNDGGKILIYSPDTGPNAAWLPNITNITTVVKRPPAKVTKPVVRRR